MNGVKVTMISILVSVFLLPEVQFAALPAIRMEDILVLICCLVIISRLADFQFTGPIIIYLFCLLITLAWTFITILANNHVTADYFELYKISKFIIILLFFYSISMSPSVKSLSIINVLKTIFVVTLGFNISNYFDILGFNNVIMPYYVRSGQILDEYARMLGTMGNPNDNAIILAYFTIVFVSVVKSKQSGNYFTSVSLVVISIILLLMTESRTAFIAIFLSLVIYVMILHRSIIGLLSICIVGILCLLIVNYFDLNYLSMLWTMDIENNDSWTARVDLWEYLFGMINESPWIGHGPYKTFLYNNAIFVDSEYVQHALRYGYIGLGVYLLLVICPFITALSYRKLFSANMVGLFSIVILVCGITNAPLAVPQISVLYALTCGFMYGDIAKLNGSLVVSDEEVRA